MAESNLVLNGDATKYATAIARCDAALATKWTKLEQAAVAKGTSCPTSGDHGDIQTQVTYCTTALAASLAGTPTSTATDAFLQVLSPTSVRLRNILIPDQNGAVAAHMQDFELRGLGRQLVLGGGRSTSCSRIPSTSGRSGTSASAIWGNTTPLWRAIFGSGSARTGSPGPPVSFSPSRTFA